MKARSKSTSYDSAFLETYDSHTNAHKGLQIDNSDYTPDTSHGPTTVRTDAMEGDTNNRIAYDTGIPWSNYATYEIIRVSSSEVRFYQADAHLRTDTDPSHIFEELGYVGFHVWDGSSESTVTVDWIFVRNYASTEPGTTVGTPSPTGQQPVPELPTVILFSVGLLVLAGYALLRKRL